MRRVRREDKGGREGGRERAREGWGGGGVNFLHVISDNYINFTKEVHNITYIIYMYCRRT